MGKQLGLRVAWWLLVMTGFTVYAAVTLLDINIEAVMGERATPSVVQVANDGADLWASSYEQTVLQGGEQRWWVSTDGGRSWAEGWPSARLMEAESVVDGCTSTACYRLVDGRRLERRPITDPAAWRVEHVRPEASVPPEHGHNWIPDRSIAMVDGPDGDAVVVADGHDGVLRRGADGAWANHPVGHSWFYEIRWWLVAIAAVGAAFVVLLGDVLIRASVPSRSADWTGRGVGLSS